MAGLSMKIQTELRPCWITNGEKKTKALFHCWSYIGPASDISVAAIVEVEGGYITLVHPQSIKFLDDMFSEYIWEKEE